MTTKRFGGRMGKGARVSEIKFPYARDEVGLPVHIGVAERGDMFSCLACESEMIVKKGEIKQHHFAHKAEENAALCALEPGKTIHNAVRDIIHWGLTNGGEYLLEMPCVCGRFVGITFPNNEWVVMKEWHIVSVFGRPRFIADVALEAKKKAMKVERSYRDTFVAIEVQLTHSDEVEKTKAYQDKHATVMTVELDYRDALNRDVVTEFKSGARADKIMRPFFCGVCRATETRRLYADPDKIVRARFCEKDCGRPVLQWKQISDAIGYDRYCEVCEPNCMARGCGRRIGGSAGGDNERLCQSHRYGCPRHRWVYMRESQYGSYVYFCAGRVMGDDG